MVPAPVRPLPPAFGPEGRPSVVGHRGASGAAPENTLAAFEAAWRAGADAIEFDLHLTADGVAVVIHDSTVDATTDGSGEVGQLTYAAVRALDAGSWFSPAFAGQPVPRLEEILRFAVSRPELGILVEYKGEWTTAQVAVTARAVDAAGVGDRTVAQSFSPGTLEALREVAPHLPRGLLVDDDRPEAVGLAAELGVLTVNPSSAAVRADRTLVERLHDDGRRVMAWTENEPTAWADLVEAGVDGIITDRPEHLRGWLADSGRRVAPGGTSA
ncbi:glycerophosphodiester phosphodiesterase family protein [Isoptericola variabilis]|uniref:Glycerophosphoryl diester phosphodiesterase n=1 Tax=Isoptericola variabilis (strain 225) TaxID=743718 RepID=F6FTG4_ISOV2|nr:glycerophosphodiester phosphodiesterase family protein [Isoptericola variabilis]AEG43157.1 glycerophosphoryl diester phosphodiesterase [Isoptericola variabilis 225]TWH35088.1 glycerophosphoryl diester phosphodiesterase [Isoptericola variabilis J7]